MSFENIFIFHFQISVIRYRNKLKQSLNKEALQRWRKVCEILGEQAVKTWHLMEQVLLLNRPKPGGKILPCPLGSTGSANRVVDSTTQWDKRTDGCSRVRAVRWFILVHTSNLIHMSGQVWHIRQIRRHSRWTNDTGAQGKDYILIHFSIVFQ